MLAIQNKIKIRRKQKSRQGNSAVLPLSPVIPTDNPQVENFHASCVTPPSPFLKASLPFSRQEAGTGWLSCFRILEATGSIPWAAPPFSAHLGACALIVTPFRKKPEQLFLPPHLVLPAFFPSQLALGPGLPSSLPTISILCYFARTSPSSNLVALHPHSCVYIIPMFFF